MRTQIERLRALSQAREAKKYSEYFRCLLMVGEARTGCSGYSNGHAYKTVNTEELCYLLASHGINHEKGNDATRGGANGEFVRLKGAVLKTVLAEKKKRDQKDAEELKQKKEQRERARQAYCAKCDETYNFCKEKNFQIDFSPIGESEPRNFLGVVVKMEDGGYVYNIHKRFYHDVSCALQVQNNDGLRKYVQEKALEKFSRTQISGLINGSVNVIRNEHNHKYVNAHKATSHDGYAGSNRDERMLISGKVFSENGDSILVRLYGAEYELKLGQSLSGKTKWYEGEIIEFSYLKITGCESHPYRDCMQRLYKLIIHGDMTVEIQTFRRGNENQQWKQGPSVFVGEEFVEILYNYRKYEKERT